MNNPGSSSPTPRVDVVMAAHNAAAFIGAAVSSALAQRGVHIEVYVADDGSTDDTAAIVTGFDDPRVHLFADGPFDTIAQARNRAASHGTAEWISYLDADDIWPEYRTATLIDAISDPQKDIAYGHMLTFPDGAAVDTTTVYPPGTTPAVASPGTTIFSRALYEQVGKLDETLRMGEFIDWMARARHEGFKEIPVPVVALLRRAHANNTTRDLSAGAGDYLRLVAAHLARQQSRSADEPHRPSRMVTSTHQVRGEVWASEAPTAATGISATEATSTPACTAAATSPSESPDDFDSSRPAVTVALPVYNGARFVEEAIDSVLNQVGWDVHVVAVDDGSTDTSAEVLARLAANDDRITVLRFRTNRGVAAARNTAITSRDDPLVALIDQDDLWTPDRLDRGWAALSHNPAMAFTTGHLVFDEPGGPLPRWFRPQWLDGPQPGNVFGTLLAWRERGWLAVGDLDESLRHGGDDTDWFVRARDLGIPHVMVPQVVLHRRVHEANASQHTDALLPELFEVLRRRHR